MKRSVRLAALALAAAPLAAAVPAGAAPVVNTYQVVSRFTSGAVLNVTQQFSLAFDPAVASTGSVLNYSSTVSNPSFNPPSGVIYALSPSSSSLTTTSTLLFGGAINGIDAPQAGTADFQTFFFVAPTSGTIVGGVPLVPFSAITRYATAAGTVETTDVTVTLISSAVPEVATWAMMIAGFGTIGLGLRARRGRVAVAFRPA